MFDLGTLTSVPLTALASDASGNVVTLSTSFAVDDPTVLTLTDHGDGTAVAVRARTDAGKATVTATVTNPDGSTITGTLEISIAAVGSPNGNAVAVEIVPGTPS